VPSVLTFGQRQEIGLHLWALSITLSLSKSSATDIIHEIARKLANRLPSVTCLQAASSVVQLLIRTNNAYKVPSLFFVLFFSQVHTHTHTHTHTVHTHRHMHTACTHVCVYVHTHKHPYPPSNPHPHARTWSSRSFFWASVPYITQN